MFWFGFLGGAIAWTIHLLAAYAIAEWVCVSRVFAVERFLGVAIVAWLLIGVSILTALVAGAATWVAYLHSAPGIRGSSQLSVVGSRLRESLLLTDNRQPTTDNRLQELAQIGWVMSALFLFTILVQSIPIFYWLEGC